MTDFKLPNLGESIEYGTVVKIPVAVGDTINLEQAILELETDKAVLEVPASFQGKITKINVKMGDKVKVGQVVFSYEEAAGSSQKTVPQSVEAPKKEAASAPPPPRETKTESAVSPALAKPSVQTQPVPSKTEVRSGQAATSATTNVPASPAVRRYAREKNIDLNQVRGSGAGGRVSEADIDAFLQSPEPQSTQSESTTNTKPTPTLPDFNKWGSNERVAMSGIRRKTAEHMSAAWNTIPHVTQFDTADITNLEKLRKQFGKKVEAAGGKLTLTVIILKIIASALKVFPQFNASVDMANEEIVYKKYFHIGVAVDTERGLLVPVIRDVDHKNILELAVDLAQAGEKARQKKTTLEEMQGASFTITNLGSIGGTHFTPIINWPEVAILGVGQSTLQPVWIDDKFEPRLILPLSLSYDHRLIDGADAARFLRWVANAVKEPFLMDLEG